MKRHTLLLLTTALLTASCNLLGGFSEKSGGELSIVPDRQAYTPSQKAVAHFENGRSSPVHYDRCATTLERKTEDGWEAWDGMVCDPLAQQFGARRIDPDGSMSDELVWFGPGDASGTHRFKFGVRDAEGDPLPEEERRTRTVRVISE